MTVGSLVLGVLNGMSFGLLALGVVLVYKSDRFLNVAYAQLGAAPALVLAKLVIDWGWSWWLAFAASAAIGALLGLVVERWLIAPLRARNRSPVSLLLMTLGVGELLLALTYIPALGPKTDEIAIAGYPVPFHSSLTIGNVLLGGQDIVILVLAPLLVFALAAFLRFTLLGKQIRATAANRDAARLAGVSVRRVSALTWGIAGALSAMTAVLQAPSEGTFNAAALGPGLLLVALGAAAFGAFTSMPWALAGGLVLGVAQQIALSVSNNAGTADVVVLVLILCVVVVRGRSIGAVFATRGAVAAPTPSPRVPAVVAERWVVTRSPLMFGATAVFVAALLPTLPGLQSESRRFELALIVMYALVAVSLCVLVGWAGQVSLGQFAIVGLGAFVTARLVPHGLSLLVILVIAGVVGAAASVVVGLPALRVPGLSLAVTSLGLAVIAPEWLFRQSWVGSAQPFGLTVDLPDVVRGIGMPSSEAGTYYLGLVLLVLIVAAMAAVRRSASGRAMLAVRDNEIAAASFGLTPATVKLAALATSGFIAGLAGVVWAGAWHSVTATQFTPDLSLSVLAAPVIGGVASLSGSVAGATFLYALTLFVSPHLTSLFGDFGQQIGFQLALGGAGVVVVMLAYPDGLAGFAQRCWTRLLGRIAATVAQADADAAPTAETPLVVTNAVVSFGGVRALAGASIRVEAGEVVGLIGPNGAGKSTLMNVVSGTVRPEQASVRVFGRELAGLPAEYRPAFGVARSYQDAALFAGLTVTEAIQLAGDQGRRTGIAAAAARVPWARRAERRSRTDAVDLVERFGLSPWASATVAELSTGTRRICDLAAQVAAHPRLLLLDEPTAGVAQRDAEAFAARLRELREELDCAVLVIEHDMALLMSVCDRIYAMDGGRVIAEGTPEQIRSDPLVVASYLGTDPAAVRRTTPAPRRRARATVGKGIR
ncbi:MAG TPA: ATP-binding cassette domain-containing protein [Mycobacteriales bacterium]|nr:ATP-binding cassette domain-containing protein [Mycobacteriales bacterium]